MHPFSQANNPGLSRANPFGHFLTWNHGEGRREDFLHACSGWKDTAIDRTQLLGLRPIQIFFCENQYLIHQTASGEVESF